MAHAKCFLELASFHSGLAAFKARFSQAAVLKIIQMILDELFSVKGLRPGRLLGELSQAIFDCRVEPDRNHRFTKVYEKLSVEMQNRRLEAAGLSFT